MDCKVNAGLLILVHVVLQLGLAQLVECDDDQSDEDVDEEKGEDNEENDVEDSLFRPVPGYWSHVLICRRHRVL